MEKYVNGRPGFQTEAHPDLETEVFACRNCGRTTSVIWVRSVEDPNYWGAGEYNPCLDSWARDAAVQEARRRVQEKINAAFGGSR